LDGNPLGSRAVGHPAGICEVIMTVILLIVIIAIVVIAAVAVIARRRRTALPAGAGPEYDRLEREMGPRQARSEFAKRQQRVDGLDIKTLSGARRAAYEAQWSAAQEQFIESPRGATQSAASLVTAVAAEEGYPVDDDSQLLTDLSVYHGRPLDGYRQARRLTEQAEQAETEQLRQAVLEYRAMFQDLLGPADDDTNQPKTASMLAAAKPRP
jgi:hypothetical protein